MLPEEGTIDGPGNARVEYKGLTGRDQGDNKDGTHNKHIRKKRRRSQLAKRCMWKTLRAKEADQEAKYVSFTDRTG